MTWVHWVLCNISPDSTGLPEGGDPPPGSVEGINDWKRTGYGGPCPPGGSPHRYFFKIYALDAILDLEPGENKKNLLEAMDGRVLAEGRLMGRYTRR